MGDKYGNLTELTIRQQQLKHMGRYDRLPYGHYQGLFPKARFIQQIFERKSGSLKQTSSLAT